MTLRFSKNQICVLTKIRALDDLIELEKKYWFYQKVIFKIILKLVLEENFLGEWLR